MRIIACAIVILIPSLCSTAHSQRKGKGSDMFRRFVTALPPVDKVEVLAVTHLQTDDLKQVDCARTDLACAPGRFPLEISEVKTLAGEEAEQLSALWRKLERDHLHSDVGCFSPAHILRFYRNDKLLLETEVGIFQRVITLPNRGVVSVAGSITAPYHYFQGFLAPDSSIKLTLEKFKREMMPKVGQQITIIGGLGGGKLGPLIPFKEGGVYIRALKDSDIRKLNDLHRFTCHRLKVPGTLRYFPEVPPKFDGPEIAARPPEHFYFDVAEVRVVSLSPPRFKRPKRNR